MLGRHTSTTTTRMCVQQTDTELKRRGETGNRKTERTYRRGEVTGRESGIKREREREREREKVGSRNVSVIVCEHNDGREESREREKTDRIGEHKRDTRESLSLSLVRKRR